MLKHECMTEYIIISYPITWMYDRRYIQHNIYICSLAGWVRDPRTKYNLLTMLSIVLFLRSYLFYDYIGIVFITHVHTHLYYSPSRSDTHHFTITLLNIYHHTIKYKSFLNHTIT